MIFLPRKFDAPGESSIANGVISFAIDKFLLPIRMKVVTVKADASRGACPSTMRASGEIPDSTH